MTVHGFSCLFTWNFVLAKRFGCESFENTSSVCVRTCVCVLYCCFFNKFNKVACNLYDKIYVSFSLSLSWEFCEKEKKTTITNNWETRCLLVAFFFKKILLHSLFKNCLIICIYFFEKKSHLQRPPAVYWRYVYHVREDRRARLSYNMRIESM